MKVKTVKQTSGIAAADATSKANAAAGGKDGGKAKGNSVCRLLVVKFGFFFSVLK